MSSLLKETSYLGYRLQPVIESSTLFRGKRDVGVSENRVISNIKEGDLDPSLPPKDLILRTGGT